MRQYNSRTCSKSDLIPEGRKAREARAVEPDRQGHVSGVRMGIGVRELGCGVWG